MAPAGASPFYIFYSAGEGFVTSPNPTLLQLVHFTFSTLILQRFLQVLQIPHSCVSPVLATPDVPEIQ